MRKGPWLSLFLLFAVSLWGDDKKVTFNTQPEGAQVEFEGRIVCPSTPCAVSFPDFYFRKHFTYWSKRLSTPLDVTVRKQGFASKTVTLTQGPFRWQAWNTPDHFDYFRINDTQFIVALDPAGTGVGHTTTRNVSLRDVFVWFDEPMPKAGTRVVEVIITTRAYDEVIGMLRQIRGDNTEVLAGRNVLETNYHPATFPLGQWLTSASEEILPSVFYWNGERLSDTTPVMSFYMTEHAYQACLTSLSAYFSAQAAQQPNSPAVQEQQKFWRTSLTSSQAAASGMANFYTVSGQNKSEDYTLEKNPTRKDEYTSAVLSRIQQQQSESNRLLTRFKTGTWAN